MFTTQNFKLDRTFFNQFEAIKPLQCFALGAIHTAEKISVESINDNLHNYVLFKYTLVDANDVFAGEGHFELSGADYPLWDATADGAYALVSAGIGVELLKAGE